MNVAVTVLVADPDPFFAEALSSAIERPDVDVVGWTTDELEAARLIRLLDPDVLVTEVTLRPGSGLSLSRHVGEHTRTLVLTRRHEGDIILSAVAAGALGCVGHDTSVDALRSKIAEVAAGRFAVDADRLHEILKRASTSRGDSAIDGMSRLTPREREVLELLGGGMDDEAIARQLYLSARTVRTHVGKILRKLDVHSRADAARLVLRAGGGGAADVLRIEGPELGRT